MWWWYNRLSQSFFCVWLRQQTSTSNILTVDKRQPTLVYNGKKSFLLLAIQFVRHTQKKKMIVHCANRKSFLHSQSLSISSSSSLRNVSLITCLMVMILIIETVRCINFFPPTFTAAPRFSNSKLYNVTKNLNLENIQARAACLADVNDDT